MATKSAIVAYILARWGDITSPKRVPLLDREVSNAIVDELYPNSVTDNHTAETYTTKGGTNLGYSIRITKSGNIANIRGTVSNLQPVAFGSQSVFSFKNTEFRPKEGQNNFTFFANQTNGTAQIKLFLSGTELVLIRNINPSTTYEFDFKTYITQD
jgi:hypothetical protein